GVRRDRRDGVRHAEGPAGARREDQAFRIRELRGAAEEVPRRPQPPDRTEHRDLRPPRPHVPAFAGAEERPEQERLKLASTIDGSRGGCYDAAPAGPVPGRSAAW